MVLFRCSYLGHRSPWKLNMARFEESKDGPLNWYNLYSNKTNLLTYFGHSCELRFLRSGLKF